MRVLLLLVVLAPAVSADPPPLLLTAAFAALAAGMAALVEPIMRSAERVGALDPTGAVILGDAGLRLHHESVLAADAVVPWTGVSAIVVDQGKRWRFPYRAGGRRRYLLDNPAAGITPKHRPPLLSAMPVRPNVLFLPDPPADVAWSHPEPFGTPFVGVQGVGAPALPWGRPGPTPAVWVAVKEPQLVERHPEARTRLRALTATDVHRLRYELGDLPGPNPYRPG